MNAAERPIWRNWVWLRVVLAFMATAAIYVIATLASAFLTGHLVGFLGYGGEGVVAPGTLEAERTARLGIFLGLMQVICVVLTVIAARSLARPAAPLLPMQWPATGLRGILLAVAGLILLTGTGGMIANHLDPTSFSRDMQPFAEMARTRSWWILFIAAAIGAPLSEELLFRGFLFGSLRPTPLAFVGTALITAATWSSLHANYSIYGVALIVGIGLYFAYLREKSSSLIPSLVCHAVYNGGIVLAMALGPDTAFSVP